MDQSADTERTVKVDDTSLTDRIFSDVRVWLDNVSLTNYEELYKPIAHDTPEEVIDTATKAEAYCYNIILEINNCNTLLAMMNRIRAIAKMKAMSEHAKEKVAVAEAKTGAEIAEIDELIDRLNANLICFKQILDQITRRCSLCQSYLSNMSTMVKAGVHSV